MCGLVLGVDRVGGTMPAALIETMGARLAHRGPDGRGTWADGPVAMHHRRLAIFDPEHGQQPMISPDGSVIVVFNGAIYNHVELRAELIADGASFRTQSDTEVLLHLYARDGLDLATHLNGMFAFCIYDRRRRRVLTVRDRMGIKPLYVHQTQTHVLYASEIKALLAHPDVERRANFDHLGEYLTFQHLLGEATLFAGITRLSPGHLQVIDLVANTVETRPWWAPSYAVDLSLTEADAVDALDTLLTDAVCIRTRSDVPVGTYLSGGLDSSMVTLRAAGWLSRAPAFHGTFNAGPRYDESQYAEQVAARANVPLHQIQIDGARFATQLPDLIASMDEPAGGPGLFPQAEVTRTAAAHVKVMLGGQGGDELFAGYTRYLVAYLEQALKGAIYQTNDEGEHIVSLQSILPNLPFVKQYVPMLRRFWSEGLFEPMDRRYFRLLDRSEGQLALLSTDVRRAHDAEAVFARFQTVFHQSDTPSYISKMRAFDRIASLPALLQVEDRVSMAVGVESRVPLLDHRIVELIDRLPPRLVFGGGQLKHLLRTIGQAELPPAVAARQDKMGFPLPLDTWMRGVARPFVEDIFRSQRFRERGIFDSCKILQALDQQTPYSRALWGVLCLELWFRAFIDEAA